MRSPFVDWLCVFCPGDNVAVRFSVEIGKKLAASWSYFLHGPSILRSSQLELISVDVPSKLVTLRHKNARHLFVVASFDVGSLVKSNHQNWMLGVAGIWRSGLGRSVCSTDWFRRSLLKPSVWQLVHRRRLPASPPARAVHAINHHKDRSNEARGFGLMPNEIIEAGMLPACS